MLQAIEMLNVVRSDWPAVGAEGIFSESSHDRI